MLCCWKFFPNGGGIEKDTEGGEIKKYKFSKLVIKIPEKEVIKK